MLYLDVIDKNTKLNMHDTIFLLLELSIEPGNLNLQFRLYVMIVM